MDEKQIKTLIDQALSDEAAIGWQNILLSVLDWPFLLFVFLVAFVFLFREKIVGLLERGDIQVSWGKDRHIKLRDLSDGIDGELDPIREELAQLKEQLASANVLVQPGATPPPATPTPAQIQAATDRMMDGLRAPQYRWRSVKRLAAMAAIPEDQTLHILRDNPHVVLGKDKYDRPIARAKTR